MNRNQNDDRATLEDMGLHIVQRWETLKSVRIAHRERVDSRAELLVVHALVHNRDVAKDERRALLVFALCGEVRTCITMRGDASAHAVAAALAALGPAATRAATRPDDGCLADAYRAQGAGHE